MSIISVQLLLEHPAQVNKTADGKTKDFRSKIYTVHNMWTVYRK